MTNDDRRPDDPLDERLAAYHEALLAGEAAAEEQADGQLARAQKCLELIEKLRRQSSAADSVWLFGSSEAEAAATSATQKGALDTLLHCSRKPPQQIGRFRIERFLGEGGFGIVLLATDPDLNRQVALKVPRPETLLSPAGRGRFLREAEAAALLSHPHLVPVYEVGHAGSLCYIVQAYCHGSSLDRWLAQRGSPVSPQAAARLILVLAEAVQHAHSRGVLHRDIKPSNVLLESAHKVNIAEGELAKVARLSDFGLARLADQPLDRTHHGAVLGSPPYMAPEQAEGRSQHVGTAADIYALGAVLYELLTGKPPHQGDSVLTTLEAVRRHEPAAPRQRNPAVPIDLEAICLKCLEKDPRRRYPTAYDLAEDLDRYLAGRVVTARRATRLEHLHRWCRRNPVPAVLAMLVILLGLLMIGGSTGAALLLSAARQQAVDHLQKAVVARKRATQNEDVAVRALFEARVAEAMAIRRSGVVGQRLDALDALTKAALVIPRLNLGAEQVLRLRNEAIECTRLIDLQFQQSWQSGSERPLIVSIDSDVKHYAYAQDSRTVAVRRLGDASAPLQLAIPDTCTAISDVYLDSHARYVACRCRTAEASCRLLVWSVASAELLLAVDCMAGHAQPLDFSPDGHWLALPQLDGKLTLLSLPDLKQTKTVPGDKAAWTLRFSPTSDRLAIYRTGTIEILELASGELTDQIDCPAFAHQFDWSPDGKLVAVACEDRAARIWQLGQDQFATVFSGHGADVTRVAFHAGGNFLATSSLDHVTRLWDRRRGDQLLRIDQELGRFSGDGQWLATSVGRFRVVLPEEQQLYVPQLPGSKSSAPQRLSVDPTGRLLAVNSRDQLSLMDLLTGETLVQGRVGGAWVVFEPDGGGLVAVTHATGLCRLPMRREEDTDGIIFRFADRQAIAAASLGHLDISRDSKLIAFVDRYYRPKLAVHDVRQRLTRQLRPHHEGARWLDLTSNGARLAVGTVAGRNVTIWNAQTGELIKSIKAGPARVQFSPDGQRLVVDEGDQCTVWDTAGWEPLHVLRLPNTLSKPGPIAYSDDGRLLAVMADASRVRLLDGETFLELASLHLPADSDIHSLAFSPQAVQLIAGNATSAGVLVWELASMRLQLRQMNLDWPHPPPPSPPPEAAKAVAAKLDLLELFPFGESPDQFAEEIRTLSTRIATNAKDASAYWQRGKNAFHLRQYEQAIADCTQAIRLEPDVHHGYFWRGRAYQRQYQCAAAIADFEKSLKLHPNDSWCCRHLADLYALGPAEVRDADRALLLAKEAVQLFHKTTSEYVDTFLTTLAVAYYRSGDLEQTLETLERAKQARRYDQDASILFLRAMCLQKLDQPHRARRCYDEALQWQETHGSTPYLHVLQQEASALLGI